MGIFASYKQAMEQYRQDYKTLKTYHIPKLLIPVFYQTGTKHLPGILMATFILFH